MVSLWWVFTSRLSAVELQRTIGIKKISGKKHINPRTGFFFKAVGRIWLGSSSLLNLNPECEDVCQKSSLLEVDRPSENEHFKKSKPYLYFMYGVKI